jgi:predicted GNAT family acetyltransferase
MVALTDLAFPGYFRRETYRMGTYMGVRVEGQLVAMAGERMAFDDWVEISAVCVHPDFLGRGFAQHLVARLLALHAERGKRSFLHVSPENAGAIKLYEKLGFNRHAVVRLCRMRVGA